jgi:hypothetical protein
MEMGETGAEFYTLFWIRDILRPIRILGSVHWITDPDLSVNGFKDANKK